MDASYTEKLAKEAKSSDILNSEKIIEWVDELFSFRAEDLIEYFFIVAAYDLR